MATKELAFNAKIKNLNDYLHQIVSFAQPPPPGTDVGNTIKYFITTLLNILKDAPNIQGEKFYGAKYARSNVRLAMFPTLNYSGLFEVTCGLLPVVHLVTIGQEAIMDNLLQLVACITSFLTWDQLTQLPYKVAMILPMAQPSQYEEIVRILCVNLLPNTLGLGVGNNMLTTEATAAMLMLILQHCTDPKSHTMFLEALLPLKENLYKDIFTVISYGPPNTKIPAVVLLFHYWPQLQSLVSHVAVTDSYTVTPWHVPTCQRVHCINKIARPSSSKMCTHPNMCAAECQLPPPAFICVDCYDTHGMRTYYDSFVDIVLPSEHISLSCGNKGCPSPESTAVAVCTSLNCVKMNRFRPISLCSTCNANRHPMECGYVQQSIGNIWTLELDTQSYAVDAIVSLLREAEPESKSPVALQPIMDNSTADFLVPKNPVNSRYGVLLLKELGAPQPRLCVNSLGRLLAMLFHWFLSTGSSQNLVDSSILEGLKGQCTSDWLQQVKKSHYEVILSTLLPHPPDFAKVGGQWEKLSSRTDQIKEGLAILIKLGPYDIVTYEVWDYIMPYWLESIRTELSLKERDEIKILLRQTFDIEMSPLPFLIDKMYHFIFERIESGDDQIQEQGLQWLQILTSVDISIPFALILSKFRLGATGLLGSNSEPVMFGQRSNIEVKLNCFILMQDMLLKQSDLSMMLPHSGITQNKSKEIFLLITDMVSCVRHIKHPSHCGSGTEDCKTCQRLSVFYHLVLNLLSFICPQLESSLPMLDVKHLAARKAGDSMNEEMKEDDQGTPHPAHNLFVVLLQVLEVDNDLDICFYVANSLKVIFVHGQGVNAVYRTHPSTVEAFLEQQFVPRLWKMLDSSQSRTSALAVSMLLHAIALGDGHRYFWDIVKGDCMHRRWQIRYAAVDKIRMIWENSSVNLLSKNQVVMTALAHVFCQYVTLLHDPDHNVAQRALLQLQLLGQTALQAIIRCMSVQFDVVVKDRHLIMHKLLQLQNAMPDREVFSWSFFLARLQQLFVEAELHENSETSGGRGSMLKVGRDQNLDQMLKIAQFAAMRCDSISSIRENSGVYSKTSVSSMSIANMTTKDKKFGGGQLLKHKGKKKSGSHPEHSLQDWLMLAHESLQDLSYMQHLLVRSRKDEVMPEVGSENAKIIKTLWRAMEGEKLDHSILHLLITTIVKYMSTPATNELLGDEPLHATRQGNTIEHIFYLLGYTDGRFFVKSSQLRVSPVIDALLTNLPKFLDGNVELGTKILPDCLTILRYCGSPQKYASDSQAPNYTLVHLPPSLTKYWVQSLLIILYKYNYSNNSELSPAVNYLVHIVLNTLCSIPHSCKRRESDTGSVVDVQGVIQGAAGPDRHSLKTDNDDCEAQAGPSHEPTRQRSTTVLPGTAGLLIGATAIIHEEDELEPLSISRRSTMDKSDITSFLMKPQGAKSAGSSSSANKSAAASSAGVSNNAANSKSSLASKKPLTTNDNAKPGKKNKKLRRQTGIDQASPSKSDHKLKHWKTVDSTKSDDFMSALENPQKAAGSPATAATADHAEPEIGGGAKAKATSSTDVVLELKKAESSKKFGGMLSKMGKRQHSKQNVLGAMGSSTEDDQTAIIQSAAAASKS